MAEALQVEGVEGWQGKQCHRHCLPPQSHWGAEPVPLSRSLEMVLRLGAEWWWMGKAGWTLSISRGMERGNQGGPVQGLLGDWTAEFTMGPKW